LSQEVQPLREPQEPKPKNPIGAHLERSLAALERANGDAALLATAQAIAAAVIGALRSGNKILLVGNGGSAADAQHIAAEIIGRYKQERPAWAAVALSTDTSALTAIGNDYGFEQIFARQIEGLGQRGHVLLALSTSGAFAEHSGGAAHRAGPRTCHHRLHRQQGRSPGRAVRSPVGVAQR
jgi:phosphoheptose isomerase